MIGTTLGPYQVLSKLGEGGMGEVYRARDTKLNRDVALKVLPEAFTLDPDRLARFKREAQVLASLNHPNIGAIYGFEESVSTQALVLELVEGPTLADRLAQGPVLLHEAVPIAKQIAEALEAAHEQGIIHRDLKPANIKLRPDGTVKVLDFGLAKALAADPVDAPADYQTRSPTITTPAMTRAGVILGTAAYMAPEQARGKAVDKRADIWAFGVVFYEMLTGTALFHGETTSDSLAAVLTKDPDWARVPSAARLLLRRCLERDPKKRLRDIGDALSLLEAAPDQVRPRASWMPWIAVAALVAIGVAAWGWLRPPASARPVMRFAVVPPSGLPPAPGGVALSRDGSMLAFVSGPRRQIHVRSMDQLEAKALPGTEEAQFLDFSPDGKWISYVDEGVPQTRLYKVAVDGGSPQVLAQMEQTGPPAQRWADDNTILWTRGGLVRVTAGGTPQVLATSDRSRGEMNFHGPQLLPDGRSILVSILTAPSDGGSAQRPGVRGTRTIALDPQTGQRTLLLEVAAEVSPAYVEDAVLKSRRVVPGRLLQNGFVYQYPVWDAAARDLCQRSKAALKRESNAA